MKRDEGQQLGIVSSGKDQRCSVTRGEAAGDCVQWQGSMVKRDEGGAAGDCVQWQGSTEKRDEGE